MHTREEKLEAFGRLMDVLDQLRQKCPWDKKQTNESLRPNTIEETFELCDALMKNDAHNICKELGDVLMHVLFYAKIGSETDDFDLADVCNTQADKLIFRHPHIYHPSQVGKKEPLPLDDPRFVATMENGEGENGQKDASDTTQFQTAKTSDQVLQNWEQIKLREKDGNKSVLSGVPDALPSLIKAYRIQDKARNVGFDWAQKTKNTLLRNWAIFSSRLSMPQDYISSIPTMPWNIQTRSLSDGLIMLSNTLLKRVNR